MRRDSNYVGPAIARLRSERGWTQEQLAEQMEKHGLVITRQIVANIESCRRVATDKLVYHFARALAVSVEELYPRTRRKPG